MTVMLVTGGAGYVGSQAVLARADVGYLSVVLDRHLTGVRKAVPEGVRELFGRQPVHDDLHRIVGDALAWEGRIAEPPALSPTPA